MDGDKSKNLCFFRVLYPRSADKPSPTLEYLPQDSLLHWSAPQIWSKVIPFVLRRLKILRRTNSLGKLGRGADFVNSDSMGLRARLETLRSMMVTFVLQRTRKKVGELTRIRNNVNRRPQLSKISTRMFQHRARMLRQSRKEERA